MWEAPQPPCLAQGGDLLPSNESTENLNTTKGKGSPPWWAMPLCGASHNYFWKFTPACSIPMTDDRSLFAPACMGSVLVTRRSRPRQGPVVGAIPPWLPLFGAGAGARPYPTVYPCPRMGRGLQRPYGPLSSAHSGRLRLAPPSPERTAWNKYETRNTKHEKNPNSKVQKLIPVHVDARMQCLNEIAASLRSSR